jgi:hypothetical protein
MSEETVSVPKNVAGSIIVTRCADLLLEAAYAHRTQYLTDEQFSTLRNCVLDLYQTTRVDFNQENVTSKTTAVMTEFDKLLPMDWWKPLDKSKLN